MEEPLITQLAVKDHSYWDKLKDDRWKAKRKSILAGINFCQSCKRSDVRLQVHHNFYDRTREPWEYDSTELKVLCAECHETFTKELIVFRRDILPRMTVQAMVILNRALYVGLKYNDPLTVAYALGHIVSNPCLAKRFAKEFSE